MISYLIKGILIGLLFGMPIGGVIILIMGLGLLCRRSEAIGNIPQKQTADFDTQIKYLVQI